MTDFNAFRTAVLADDDLQEQVISIINTATANGSGLGDGIATLAKNHGYNITSDEVYAHADFIGQDGDLTDFELELISGGQDGSSGC
jgi:predicted ribosomally synthesized peptide with nif11-like leader